jgi:hypothetical protein
MKHVNFLLIAIAFFSTGLLMQHAAAASDFSRKENGTAKVTDEDGNKAPAIEWIDIAMKQVRLMRAAEDLPQEKRDRLLLDSIFMPHTGLWHGYLGQEAAFLNWVNNTAFSELSEYERKLKEICTLEMQKIFARNVQDMKSLTGFTPQGKWYVFFGPKWTNLGGLGDGTMLIDLANSANTSLEDITRVFAHEINHQIYSLTCPQKDNAVLYRILNEGFACYVSYLYHQESTSIARELAYTEAQYRACRDNDARAIELLREHYQSNDSQLSRLFAHRQYLFYDDLPGALGYYIGFRIVEEYVKRFGTDSWIDIYTLQPEEVLMKSDILNLYQ